jgi:hypothetical protein
MPISSPVASLPEMIEACAILSAEAMAPDQSRQSAATGPVGAAGRLVNQTMPPTISINQPQA